MRNAFISKLFELAQKDKDIVLLTADIGYGVLDQFFSELPGQIINCGISEANMTGVAAGLSLRDKKCFTYTIIPFLTMRCLEQIRVDICIQNLNVKIVGVGGGFAYGELGPTHHAIEDISLLRSLPNMTVLVPADPCETSCIVESLHEVDGPVYIRLGKSGEKNVNELPKGFSLGKVKVVKSGSDVTLISCGPILNRALNVSKRLEADGILVELISINTIKPLDNDLILGSLEKTGKIISVEEHSIVGGLGSAIAELIAESNITCSDFVRLGIRDTYTFEVGDQDYLLDYEGLSEEAIYKQVTDYCN
jgi:transketolase